MPCASPLSSRLPTLLPGRSAGRALARLVSLLPVLLLCLHAAEPAVADAAAPAAAARLPWQLGVQAWTFHRTGLFETMQHVHDLGLTYIEFYPRQMLSATDHRPFDHHAAPELRALVRDRLRSLGLQASSYGVVGLGADEAEDRLVFAFAREMGMTVVVSEPPEAALPLIARLSREYGLPVAIHNHPRPAPYWDPAVELAAFSPDRPEIGSCSDTGHWARSGLVPTACLERLAGHVLAVHLKDTDAIRPGAHDVVLGTGVADLRGQLRILTAQGFHGHLSLEYEVNKPEDEIMADLRASVAAVDRIGAEIMAGR